MTAGSFSSKKPNSPTLSGTRRVEGVEGVEVEDVKRSGCQGK